MSREIDHAREIAERVARRVSSDKLSQPNSAKPQASAHDKPEIITELAVVRAGLSDLQRKIAQLEAQLGSESTSTAMNLDLSNTARQESNIAYPPSSSAGPLTHSPWLAGVNASISHPSQEKFGVEEAVVSELVDYFEKEKTCGVESGGKPCDHCAMCSSRGF